MDYVGFFTAVINCFVTAVQSLLANPAQIASILQTEISCILAAAGQYLGFPAV